MVAHEQGAWQINRKIRSNGKKYSALKSGNQLATQISMVSEFSGYQPQNPDTQIILYETAKVTKIRFRRKTHPIRPCR